MICDFRSRFKYRHANVLFYKQGLLTIGIVYHQDILYDLRVQIQETGSCSSFFLSIIVYCIVLYECIIERLVEVLGWCRDFSPHGRFAPH